MGLKASIDERDVPEDANWEEALIPEAIVYSLVKPWGQSELPMIQWVRYMKADVLHDYNLGLLSLA